MHMPGREHPYDMPTSMMAGLHTNASTFADNATTAYLPLLTSRSVIGNPGQTMQP